MSTEQYVQTNKGECPDCKDDALEVLTENVESFNDGDKAACCICGKEGIYDKDLEQVVFD